MGQHTRTDGRWRQRNGNSKNQKEMLEIKRSVIEIGNVFDGFISRPDTVEDSVRWLR